VATTSKRLLDARRQADQVFTEVFAKAAKSSDSEFARQAGDLIGPRHVDPLPGWPEPTRQMKAIMDREVTLALGSVKKSAEALGISGVYTGFSIYPVARFEFAEEGDAPEFAPLITFCLDGTIYGGLARVLAHAHSRFTRSREVRSDGEVIRRDLYPGDDGVALMERANAFLVTETILWGLARDGGFQGTVPYPVRYEASRYLWSPRIAGRAFCLRCGRTIGHQRVGRTSGLRQRTVPLCDPCLRSGSFRWPEHAVMPDTRGKWWLRCQHPGCKTPFVGPGQSRHCEAHRSNRMARSARTSRTPTRR